MNAQADTIRFSSLLHKRHGWIDAGEGAWFEQSDNLKSFYLFEKDGPQVGSRYPFGTRFNAASILAYDEIDDGR